MKQVSADSVGIELAVQSIKSGQIVIFPTDTVYGIGCNPYDKNAVDRIYRIKKRDKTKQLPVLGYSKDILKNITTETNTPLMKTLGSVVVGFFVSPAT